MEITGLEFTLQCDILAESGIPVLFSFYINGNNYPLKHAGNTTPNIVRKPIRESRSCANQTFFFSVPAH